ncbi:30S ribosomal protein S17 [Mariprofundus erugo]|uniref:Small ribosomal subunit protein uS17 n=1 Tax=Mariprofundus erugo TaxID=2528639 RepID=A0A5R9GEL3_9PROT|nr:30S ribosomal protein S17 [Mariprofundus erugo]TLS65526.1 30S ribosomal protein S17 [Mariprofundus erugo]TLS74068.1 30S ribosomal protein S17 [Mariprofundus erugo]
MSEATSNKRTLEGVVVSNKGEQTVVVQVERKFLHPRYRKTVRSHKKYMAHDAENTCNIGDIVRIIESAPISKRKRWTMVQVLTRAEQL